MHVMQLQFQNVYGYRQFKKFPPPHCDLVETPRYQSESRSHR